MLLLKNSCPFSFWFLLESPCFWRSIISLITRLDVSFYHSQHTLYYVSINMRIYVFPKFLKFLNSFLIKYFPILLGSLSFLFAIPLRHILVMFVLASMPLNHCVSHNTILCNTISSDIFCHSQILSLVLTLLFNLLI